uniref:Tubulin--tyrosine ligase-like protein 12 isoform X2 n=1 Tax=Elaeis guineensis var. tenera TaxID=51953 RepID=A0A6I9SBZ6_ELAGV|nr:tubulin--tyrosine ligase-like protein 12 isoform X2 [Elaeis guineensis]
MVLYRCETLKPCYQDWNHYRPPLIYAAKIIRGRQPSDLKVGNPPLLPSDSLGHFPRGIHCSTPPPPPPPAAMGSPSVIRDFDIFEKVHAILLAASGIPPALHRQLFCKLSSETFDGGEFFSIEPCEGGRKRRLVLSAKFLAKESDVFLIDHAWSFRLPDALKQLREVPGLAERMAALMCVDLDLKSDTEEPKLENEGDDKSGNEGNVWKVLEEEMDRVKERGSDAPAWLELEEMGIDDETLQSLDLSTKFPNLVALNLWGNKLQDVETVLQEVTKCRKLKALWLNENPVLQSGGDAITKAIIDGIPGLEIYNSCFTINSGEWALGFCGGIFGADNPDCSSNTNGSLEGIAALDLSDRSIHYLPKAFSPVSMPSLSHLNLQGNPLDQISAGDLFGILSAFTCLQDLEVDIPGPLGNSAVKILEYLPNLFSLNGVSASRIIEDGKHVIYSALQPRLPEWKPTEPLADRVIGAMWLYLMTYRLADEEKIDETSVWYVMDELGSALQHSDEANFRVAPFLFMPEGKLESAVSFSVLWPTRDVHYGEECTRDFLLGIGEDKQRSARLTAWFHTPENYFMREFKKYCQQLESREFLVSVMEALTTRSIRPSDGRARLVYTDIPQVEEFLTRPEFILTTDPKDADIIWTSMQIDPEVRKALGLSDNQYINQFPFEACLVMKHHLAETIYKAQGSPEWLQPTYNLEIQLSQLIGDYYARKQDGRDNLWILKPWNMARTIDTTVTGDLSAIIRLMETGPKICQKYIERPALFKGKKFDLRYIVLVCSMNPVEIFLAEVRLANNPYTLDKDSLFEYETHFTVMNYRGRLNHMNTPDFVREFEEEHQVKWLDIHRRIQNMIRSIFDSAAAVHPEMHSPFSRAMYGVDVMLDHQYMPKILEVTYCPDCTRACKYDTEAIVGSGGVIRGRDFFNFVFGCLFLNESTHVTKL